MSRVATWRVVGADGVGSGVRHVCTVSPLLELVVWRAQVGWAWEVVDQRVEHALRPRGVARSWREARRRAEEYSELRLLGRGPVQESVEGRWPIAGCCDARGRSRGL